MNEKPKKGWYSSFAGILAGFCEALVMHPTDTVKTRFQSTKAMANAKYSSQLAAFPVIIRHEGVMAMYKGLLPVISTVVPRVGLQYTGLMFFSPIFDEVSWLPNSLTPMLTGICTGCVQAVVAVTPLEMVKVRQMTEVSQSPKHAPKYSNSFQTASTIIREEGLPALYKGLSATAARQCWGLMIKFTGVINFKRFFDQTPCLQPYSASMAGGLTNIAVGVLNCPPDVVKTRMQDQVTKGVKEPKYRSSFHCVKVMIAEEGWRSLFRGSLLRVIRIAPGGAIQFGTFDYFLKKLNKSGW
eukprot:Lithocolla_globosa_v1_NODE_5980_length_1154_cov_6.637853.p1 type:complete len:298 gc:universal NODE_5980_length_1154_cov_6.637853:92-985(+)